MFDNSAAKQTEPETSTMYRHKSNGNPKRSVPNPTTITDITVIVIRNLAMIISYSNMSSNSLATVNASSAPENALIRPN